MTEVCAETSELEELDLARFESRLGLDYFDLK